MIFYDAFRLKILGFHYLQVAVSKNSSKFLFWGEILLFPLNTLFRFPFSQGLNMKIFCRFRNIYELMSSGKGHNLYMTVQTLVHDKRIML